MQLTPDTLATLKNFASINNSIIIREGDTIQTISEARNILAYAKLSEAFPKDFGVYDLSEFLNVLGLVESPRLRFEDTHVLIGDQSGRSTIKYFYTDTDMLTAAPATMNMPDADISFELTQDTMMKIKRAASALGHEDLILSPNDGLITLTVGDPANSTGNTFSMDVDGEYSLESFNAIVKISNLKMVQDTYRVEVSSKCISKFASDNIEYFIAFEKNSEWS